MKSPKGTKGYPVNGEVAMSGINAWRRDLVTAVLGFAVVAGVYADGWAHLNRPGLETFFTPWHGALYASLTVFAIWIGALAWKSRRQDATMLSGLPAGYRLAVAGIVLFGLGGVADMAWHQLFGIEVGVDALLSPSHLVLLTGGTLMVATGWRAQRAASPDRATFPELLSLAATAALAGFFLSYLSAFTQITPTTVFHNLPEGAPGHTEAELPVVAAIGAYLVTTALIIVAIMVTVGDRRRPPELVTVVVTTVAGLAVAMIDLPGVAVAGAVGAIAGAVVADLLMARLRPETATSRYARPLAVAATAALVWSGQLAGFAAADAVRWPVTLWAGVVVLAALAAGALALPVVNAQPTAA